MGKTLNSIGKDSESSLVYCQEIISSCQELLRLSSSAKQTRTRTLFDHIIHLSKIFRIRRWSSKELPETRENDTFFFAYIDFSSMGNYPQAGTW
jgi:hypothetical protein